MGETDHLRFDIPHLIGDEALPTIMDSESPPKILRVWKYAQSWCVVADNGIGFYLGYVSLPNGHPWRGHDFDDITADAHGGVNWAAERDWQEFDGDGAPPDFYIGFDVAHYCDTPIPGSFMSNHWPAGLPKLHPPWDEEDVAQEVNRLALQVQVAAITSGYLWSDA